MNKRGDILTEKVLNIVIAVLCLGLLFYLLYTIFFAGTTSSKIIEAESSKELILDEINRIGENGEYNNTGLLIPNPASWFMFSFVDGDLKPNSCVSENCICICEEAIPAFFDWQEKRCDEKGSCIPVSNLNKFEKIKIENNGVWILVNKVNEKIEIRKK